MPAIKRPGADDDDEEDQLALNIDLAAAATATVAAAARGLQHHDTIADANGYQSHSADTPYANKLPRTDGDFSRNKQKKGNGSSRTGQACDRCKLRKIRCDARPGGCSPCLQNNTECKTTDRITGRATSRGHTEHLEGENASLKVYIAELQQQLRNASIDPKPPPNLSSGSIPTSSSGRDAPLPQDASSGWDGSDGSSHQLFSPNGMSQVASAPGVPHPTNTDQQTSQTLDDLRSDCVADNFMGVAFQSNSWLHSIQETSLTMFGTKINVSDFLPTAEAGNINMLMTYRLFLDHMWGRVKAVKPEMPNIDQCRVYAGWYFRTIHPFFPVLHKPDFMRLLTRVVGENHQATSAETVMIHMVLSMINFQFAVRNSNLQGRHEALKHFKYALTFAGDLVANPVLESIQALTLVCLQMRNQPRPGAIWMMSNSVFSMAIETGLHRSAKHWSDSTLKHDLHHLEMRKRTFWCLLSVHAQISGRLGRPLPLHREDYDIELPIAKNDALPEESELSDWKKCSFRVSIEGFKILQVLMPINGMAYSVKSASQYESTVRQLERALDMFQAQIPSELRVDIEGKDEDAMLAYYLNLAVAECQLLLHHPSLCRSTSPQLISKNLDICLRWTSQMLSLLQQVKRLKSLDATWFSCAIYLAAIFTTLFVHTERKDQLSMADVRKLRSDMDSWVDLMGELGPMLGAPRLQSAVRVLINKSIEDLNKHIAVHATPDSITPATLPTPQDQSTLPQHPSFDTASRFSTLYDNRFAAGELSGAATEPNFQASNPNSLQSGPQYAYSGAHEQDMSYAPAALHYVDATPFTEDTKPEIGAQLAAHSASISEQQQHHHHAHQSGPAPINYLNSFHPSPHFSHSTAPSTIDSRDLSMTQSVPVAWRHFADAIVTNMSVNSADYVTSRDPGGGHASSAGNSVSIDMTPSHLASMSAISQLPNQGDSSNPPWPLHFCGGAMGNPT